MTKYIKFKDHPAAQATIVIKDSGIINLVSYTTTVATIDAGGWLHINGLYSATTRRHISWFVRDFANTDYHTAKTIYEQGLAFNIYTGEVVAER